MARLWRNQGKRDEARELLAPVCGWFTEGFETRDVKEAKALLFAMRRPTAFRQCEMTLMAQAVWKGVGMSTIVSGTLASAIVEYRSEQNRLPDRSRRSLGRLLALI